MTALTHRVSPRHTLGQTRGVSTRHTSNMKAAPKLRYIVVTLIGIGAILGGQLLLSIVVSSGAYTIASLKSEMRSSEQNLQIVAEEIGALTAPDTLATLAGSMGMVEDNNPAYLRLSDGVVLGEASPASASQGAAVFAVTAGTEDRPPPAIVNDISVALTAQAVFELSAEDALKAAVHPVSVATTAAVITPAVISPATVASGPVVKFGGSIPSPSTR